METASAGKDVVESALGSSTRCSISLNYRDRERRFDSPEEFLAKFRRADSRGIRTVGVSYHNDDGSMMAHVILYRYIIPPYVSVDGHDQSVVDGVAGQLAATFGIHRLACWGMRLYPPHGVPLASRIRGQIGMLGTVAVTAAVTASVTFLVTKLLS